MTRTSAAVLVSCLALSACDGGFTSRDLPAPDDLGGVRHGALRADGQVVPIRTRDAGPKSPGGGGGIAHLVTGVCGGGTIDTTDGSPEGGL